MKACTNVAHDYLAQCPEYIYVNAQLEPLSQYQWVITDKFENEYSNVFVTDANGFWRIPVDELPPGLLTQYSGSFELQVFTDEGCSPVTFKVAQEYDTICFDIRGGTRVKDNLGCDFTCLADGPAAGSAFFAFDAAATVLIPWTSLLQSAYGNTPVVSVYHEIAPNQYQNVTGNVVVQLNTSAYELESIYLDNGGPASGYILITN